MTSLANLITPGQIARELCQPEHRIDHILETRSHIKSLGKVAGIRVYERSAVDVVRAELQSIDARKGAAAQ